MVLSGLRSSLKLLQRALKALKLVAGMMYGRILNLDKYEGSRDVVNKRLLFTYF